MTVAEALIHISHLAKTAAALSCDEVCWRWTGGTHKLTATFVFNSHGLNSHVRGGVSMEDDYSFIH